MNSYSLESPKQLFKAANGSNSVFSCDAWFTDLTKEGTNRVNCVLFHFFSTFYSFLLLYFLSDEARTKQIALTGDVRRFYH